MVMYEIRDIENSPSILKNISFGKIIEDDVILGFYISAKYENYIKDIIKNVDTIENIEKLNKLKKIAIAQKQDPIEEGGIDDGIK